MRVRGPLQHRWRVGGVRRAVFIAHTRVTRYSENPLVSCLHVLAVGLDKKISKNQRNLVTNRLDHAKR